jgi:hypothetical protein
MEHPLLKFGGSTLGVGSSTLLPHGIQVQAASTTSDNIFNRTFWSPVRFFIDGFTSPP